MSDKRYTEEEVNALLKAAKEQAQAASTTPQQQTPNFFQNKQPGDLVSAADVSELAGDFQRTVAALYANQINELATKSRKENPMAYAAHGAEILGEINRRFAEGKAIGSQDFEDAVAMAEGRQPVDLATADVEQSIEIGETIKKMEEAGLKAPKGETGQNSQQYSVKRDGAKRQGVFTELVTDDMMKRRKTDWRTKTPHNTDAQSGSGSDIEKLASALKDALQDEK